MHRCLEIQEIARLICKQLSIQNATSESVSNDGSLAALARSCRALEEPALDALWYRQTSLIPLVKCFPSNSWKIPDNDVDGNLHFRRVPSPKEWTRVLRHATRIRFLEIPSEQANQRPPNQYQFAPVDVWQMLEFSKPGNTTYIFPNLLKISLAEKDASIPHCRILIGPMVTEFKIYVFGDAQRMSFLISVMESCPLLTNISTFSPSRKRGTIKMVLTEGISNAILRKSHLQRLVLGSLNSDAFIHIADMTLLTDLWLFDDSPISDLVKRPHKTFPSLRTFGCKGPDLHWIGSLFQTMSSPFLQTVSASTNGRYSRDLWGRACTAIHTSCANLGSLRIEESDAPLDDDEDFALGRDVLSLPIFRNLNTIVLNPFGGFDIDNQDLKDVSSGWPTLKKLTLGVSGPWIRPSRITLDGLIPLLVQCPALETLGIVIDATTPDYTLETRPGRGVCNTKITSLEVGCSEVRNPVNVAAVLSDILPCVTTINSWSRVTVPVDARQGKWDLVASNIKVFTAVRGWAPPLTPHQPSTTVTEYRSLCTTASAYLKSSTCEIDRFPRPKHTLAALAVSCRALQEPALDALWYHQTNLIPLVQCFRSDSWEIYEDEAGISTMRFCGVPLPEEWDIPLRNTAKIRCLEVANNEVLQPYYQFAPVDVWQILEISKPGHIAYIFPNLLKISLAEMDTALPHCKILIGPSVTDFEIHLFGPKEARRVSFLVSVMGSCPLLTTISSISPDHEQDTEKLALTEGISGALLRRGKLQRLYIGALTSEAFIHISDMASLTILCLFDDSPIDGLLIESHNAFPSLRSFQCVGPDLHWIGSLFQTMSSPFLQRVDISTFGRHPRNIWIDVCAPIQSTPCASLRILSIQEFPRFIAHNKDYYPLGRDFLSLPVFRNLITIFLNPFGVSDIDDEVLKDVSAGWPRSKALALGVEGP